MRNEYENDISVMIFIHRIGKGRTYLFSIFYISNRYFIYNVIFINTTNNIWNMWSWETIHYVLLFTL